VANAHMRGSYIGSKYDGDSPVKVNSDEMAMQQRGPGEQVRYVLSES